MVWHPPGLRLRDESMALRAIPPSRGQAPSPRAPSPLLSFNGHRMAPSTCMPSRVSSPITHSSQEPMGLEGFRAPMEMEPWWS